MAEQPSRAAALSAAVALVTNRHHGVSADPTELLGGVTEAEALDACVLLASVLTEHVKADQGPAVLQIVGQVASWVDSGGAHGP